MNPQRHSDAFWHGQSPFIACQADVRFSYCLYVPEQPAHTLFVYVHGTERDAAWYRDRLIPFADEYGCIVLSPSFPAGLIEPDDPDNYKNIQFHGIRFDHVLLAMVEEVARRYGLPSERFLLGGFSGGAQFAHRFYYLHPERLLALSIAAPGRVTLLDEQRDWWLGVRDIQAQFGQALNHDALQQVSVQLIVGAADMADIPLDRSSPYWMPGVEHIGVNRVERLRQLHRNLLNHRIDASLEIIPGASHQADPLIEHSITFFTSIVEGLSVL